MAFTCFTAKQNRRRLIHVFIVGRQQIRDQMRKRGHFCPDKCIRVLGQQVNVLQCGHADEASVLLHNAVCTSVLHTARGADKCVACRLRTLLHCGEGMLSVSGEQDRVPVVYPRPVCLPCAVAIDETTDLAPEEIHLLGTCVGCILVAYMHSNSELPVACLAADTCATKIAIN